MCQLYIRLIQPCIAHLGELAYVAYNTQTLMGTVQYAEVTMLLVLA